MQKIGLEAVMNMGDFNKGFGQYQNSIGSMESKTSGVAKALSASFKIIGGAVIGAGAAVAGLGAAALKLAADAAPIPSIAKTFNEFGGSIERMREGSMGMVADVDLMKRFNMAASLVSKDFATQLPDAMKYLAKSLVLLSILRCNG